jgi:rod shape-determining protein MreC
MRRFFTFLTLSLFLVLIDFLGLVGPVKALVEKGSEPIKQGFYRQITNYKLQITNLRFSQEELLEFKKRVEELERKNAVLEIENWDLKIENSAAQRLLQAPLPAEWHFLPARTLGLARYLTIDKGKRDGVKKGMVVIFENVLVGRIIEISEKSAKVILPTDQDSKVGVKTDGVRGVLIGEAKRLVFTEVLQGETIQVGDLVITSGEKEIFPPNLVIGKIKSIEKEERDPYQKAEVEPLVNYDQLERVFLIFGLT